MGRCGRRLKARRCLSYQCPTFPTQRPRLSKPRWPNSKPSWARWKRGNCRWRTRWPRKSVVPSCCNIAKPPNALHEAMRYAVLGGGKRVRALLAYAGGELARADPADVDAAAAAVELIHGYSLVHDGLPSMDNDILRR